MPFGDSITDGYNPDTPGGYRVELFRLLRKAGKNVTYVGSGWNGPEKVDGVPFPHKIFQTPAVIVILYEWIRRPDFGHLLVEITIDDPKYYSRPWTVTQEFQLDPNGELIEYACNENNIDIPHLVGR